MVKFYCIMLIFEYLCGNDISSLNLEIRSLTYKFTFDSVSEDLLFFHSVFQSDYFFQTARFLTCHFPVNKKVKNVYSRI